MASVAGEFARQLSIVLETADTPTNRLTDDIGIWIARFRNVLDDSSKTPDDITTPSKLPVAANAWLRDALDKTEGSGDFVAAVRDAANAGNWYQIYNAHGTESGIVQSPMQDLAAGMFAAQMIGPRGLIKSDQLLAGLFLLRQRLHYPLHQHQATEIYFGASGTVHIQHGIEGEIRQLLTGQFSLTPSNRLHALTAGDMPVLLLYSWLGELGGRNWWWHRDANGDWHRDAWERQPDAVWVKTATELVSPLEVGAAKMGISNNGGRDWD